MEETDSWFHAPGLRGEQGDTDVSFKSNYNEAEGFENLRGTGQQKANSRRCLVL